MARDFWSVHGIEESNGNAWKCEACGVVSTETRVILRKGGLFSAIRAEAVVCVSCSLRETTDSVLDGSDTDDSDDYFDDDDDDGGWHLIV